MDDEGQLLPKDEHGEIVIRSGMTLKEYYKNPKATKEVSLHGWHHTGDIGCKDEDGFVYIVDRKKDMIITGGFNVYPSEIEQLIMTLPQVQDCAVIGVPDEKWGEAVKAVIQTKPNNTLNEQQVIDLCHEKLGGVKTPKSVEFWDELPRSAVGKVLKKTIREAFWRDQDRRVG
jgi:acyl-CoA synthetase (AMP-forming)/AMP-acid ligase II